MRTFALLWVLAALLAACNDGDGPGANDTSRLTLLLTDQPGDFEEAVVTISSIYLQGGSDDADASGRVYLRTTAVTTDLLTLANDVETLADGVVVPAGTYGQLRFVIEGAYIKVDGTGGAKVYATPGYDQAPADVDGVLQCPSCGQSGIKVILSGGLKLEGETETVLVDFDVAETFGQEAGQSGRWVMRPSLKAASIEAAASVELSLRLAAGLTLPSIGTTLVTLGAFSAELRSTEAQEGTPGEIVSFADVDADGTFTVRFTNVLPGSYTITIRGPAGLTFATQPGFPMTLQVGSGAVVQQSLTITSASVTT